MRPYSSACIPAGGVDVQGDLHTTREAAGMVVFVHGSGVTRRERGNDTVARHLERAGFATLLLDLLQDDGRQDRHNAFDADLQAARLLEVLRWLGGERRTRSLALGLFGTGIGSSVVLAAAAKAPGSIAAVVCRGGRPDKALHCMAAMHAPTLFIDDDVATAPDWVETAYRACRAPKQLVQVRSATHLYREPAAIDAVALQAERWFAQHLARGRLQTRSATSTR